MRPGAWAAVAAAARSSALTAVVAGVACVAVASSAPARAEAARHGDAAEGEAPAASAADGTAAHYTKYEFRIPMRDGVRLHTVVYLPKDPTRRNPFLVQRTPYAVGEYNDEKLTYGVDFVAKQLGPTPDFDRAGYIFVNQDVRGRYMSEGRWTDMQPHIDVKHGPADVDDSTDMHDTVDWLLAHIPGHNGRVGIWGISYPGFYTAASIIDSHPAIKAASPQAPVTDLYMGDDAYHGGAFMLAANYGFYTGFGPQANPTIEPRKSDDFDYHSEDGYDYFLRLGTLDAIASSLKPAQQPYFRERMSRPNYDDYWKQRDIAPHLRNIGAAVLTVGGWFDAEDLQGPFTTFHAIESQSPATENAIVVGPWVHGGWERNDGARIGRVVFAVATAEQYRRDIIFPFFERHLRGEGDGPAPPGAPAAAKGPPLAKATMFETGTNVWRRYDHWPPRAAVPRTLYLQPGGGLAFTPPSSTGTGTADAAPAPRPYDEYVSDPSKPVPFVGYPAIEVPREYMVGDQRFAASRTDVLTYETPPLEEDVTVVGPVSPHLFVSTSGTDADWVVKLIDVYPNDYPDPAADAPPRIRPANDEPPPTRTLAGYQQLVRGEPMRGRFRHGFDRPEAMVPGEVTAIDFRMPDVNHTFRRGHRIMVQVQSSWFPLIDRNPQVFVPIPQAAPRDFQPATQRVYHAGTQASGLVLLVLAGPGQ